jgi:Rrf2 family protein
MLSNTGEYALRAVIHLAQRPDAGPMRVEDIAADLAVPRNYLSKILHTLVKRGILASLRGPKGGFELAVPSSLVSLYDVVEPFEDIERRTCLLGRAECSDADPCAVHGRWHGVATEVALFFRETKVSDVVAGEAEVAAILG